MKRELTKIRSINLSCLIVLSIICFVYIGVSQVGRRYLKGEMIFIITVLLVISVIINANRKCRINLISRATAVSIIAMGAACSWTTCSLVFLVATFFLSAILTYYNGEIKAYIEHGVLSLFTLVFVYVYPKVNEMMGTWINPEYKLLGLAELIICSILIILIDLFMVGLLAVDNKRIVRKNELELTTQELLRIIEAKVDEARNATKSKSDFLASMSHEIRTPINSVLGMNEMILRETKEEFTRNYATDIQNSGNMLLGLINNILDFSKIESGKMQIIPVVYDLSAVLNDMVVMISNKASSKKLEIKVDVDHTVPRVLKGDEVRIKQVITNILTNAVKYTDAGSVTIKIGYEKKDERSVVLDVRVIDTGRGMRQEDFEKLFAPFERIEELRNRHVEGTGLGMSITRQLLSLMESELEVKSVYGEGSTFGFRIRQEVVDWSEMGDYEEAYRRLRLSKEKDNHEKFTAPNAKILVVDDLKLNVNVFVNLLKRTKVQVDTALSGAEAFQKARDVSYDIIFMDHMMPEMDGVETLDKIRKDRFSLCRLTPMIALTANAVSGAREFYIEKGFADYLSKPVNPSMLEATVQNYLPEELIIPLESADNGPTSESKKTDEAKNSGEPLSASEARTNNLAMDAPMDYAGESEAGVENEASGDSIEAPFRTIPQLNVDDGIMYTGDEENYVEMAEEFYNTVCNRAGMIRDYWQSADIKNYTIQVHALKSTARIIGASELSDFAKSLEEAGHREDNNYINDFTGELLDQYMELYEALGKVIKKKDTSNLPEMSKEEIDKSIADIKDGFENFDFDKMENTVKKMEEYSMPAEFEEDFKILKGYISEVAIEEIGIWLEGRV